MSETEIPNRIERLLVDIQEQLREAHYSLNLARKGPRYASQLENLIAAVSRIDTDQRAILRALGIDPTK